MVPVVGVVPVVVVAHIVVIHSGCRLFVCFFQFLYEITNRNWNSRDWCQVSKLNVTIFHPSILDEICGMLGWIPV